MTRIKRTRPIIAIDGPVGAGKSTAARELADALGFTYLNTGAMYRAVALAAREARIAENASDLETRLERLLESIQIGFYGERVLLAGHDVSAVIADPAIGDMASRLSALAVVRARMRALQQAAGRDGGVVMEGRDIGTAVFPDAEFKFFLDADVRVRARRRWEELKAKGSTLGFDDVLAQLIERDRRDQGRELAPLRRADDAQVIDSSALTIGEVVAAMKTRIDMAERAL